MAQNVYGQVRVGVRVLSIDPLIMLFENGDTFLLENGDVLTVE